MNQEHKDLCRRIFSTFENLNLLFLIEDLRQDNIARCGWIRKHDKTTCPVAHGWKGTFDRDIICQEPPNSKFIEVYEDSYYSAAARLAGIEPSECWDFTSAWDENFISPLELIRELEGIYAERLVDADAVQGVIAEAREAERNPRIALDFAGSEK